MIRRGAAVLAVVGLGPALLVHPAVSQDLRDGRLEALEARIDAVSRQAEAVAGQERRLQEIEESLRAVTGRMEENRHLLDQVQEQLRQLEAMQRTSPSTAPAPSAAVPAPGAGPGTVPPSEAPRGPDPEPAPVSAAAVFDNEAASYQRAYELLGRADYAGAEAAFREFVRNFPNSTLTDNAYYWLGESHYVREQYAQAAAEFARGFRSAPDKQKAPDILLKLGLSLIALGNHEDACEALDRLALDFPDAPPRTQDRAARGRDRAGCN